MADLRRSARVLGAVLRASLALTLQYRLEAFGEGLLALVWVAVTLVPLIVVFGQRPVVEGWTFPEMLLVVGWFTLLKALLEGTVTPSLLQVIEHVRKGTLDFVLLKPADAQLLVSLARIEPARLFDLGSSLCIFGYAFHQLGRWPTPGQLALALVMLLAAVAVLYSLAIAVVSIAFFAVRVDNLLFLVNSLFDVARWPVTIFRGGLAFVFTWVLPLALMTTYPSLALLGRLQARTAVVAVLGAAVFSAVARAAWVASLRRYTSASS